MSDRIRVLWLVKGLAAGGAETLLVNTARVADKFRFDYEVGYVLPSHDGLVPKFAELDIPTHCLNGSNDYDLRWAATLRRLLIERRYDVVHLHSPYVAGVGRLVVRTLPARQRPRLISTEHNVWWSYAIPTRLLNALTCRLDQHRFAVSGAVQRSIWRAFRSDVELLVQGIVLADVPETRYTGSIRAELGLTPDDTLLVTVANMRPAKDYPGLLRAIRILLDQGHRVHLAAAGGGPLTPEVTALRDELRLTEHVHLLGHRQDVLTLIGDADIFVMASRWEGYPVALMEAMACGSAIVATAVGGVPDAIRDGIDGLLVDPHNPTQLATAIAALVIDPVRRTKLSAAATLRAQLFDIKRPTKRVQEVYAELARPLPAIT